jgi:hypothetical protein
MNKSKGFAGTVHDSPEIYNDSGYIENGTKETSYKSETKHVKFVCWNQRRRYENPESE